MNDVILIDKKIKEIYENYFAKLNLKLVKVPQSSNLYDEISSHTDIFLTKIR